VTVVVRAATSEDVDTVVALRLEFLDAVRGPAPRPSDDDFTDRTRSFVAAEQRAGRLHTWLAEEGSHPVGIVSLLVWPRPPLPEDERTADAYVINMYVSPAHRRRGIGRRLLDRCLGSAGELGIKRFQLHSTSDGRQLYESLGFAPSSTWMELPVPP
jgi:GNAT superfamily N-acetyltransferase